MEATETMDIWKILGIERTNDTKIIKKAYAEKAREVHPEEHPEEFQKLHNAYVDAMNYAKNMRVTKLKDAVIVETNIVEKMEPKQSKKNETIVVTNIGQPKKQEPLENTVEKVIETPTVEIESQVFIGLDSKAEQKRKEVFATVDMILNPSSSKIVRSRCVDTLLANEYFYSLLIDDNIVNDKFKMILNLECLSRKDIRKILKFLKMKNKEKEPAMLREIIKLLHMPIYGLEQTVYLFPHFTYFFVFLISPFMELDIGTNFFPVIVNYMLVLIVAWYIFIYSKTAKSKEVRMKIDLEKNMKNFLTIYKWTMVILFYIGFALILYTAVYVGDYYLFETVLFDEYYEFYLPANNTLYGILALSGSILLLYYRKVKVVLKELQTEFYNKLSTK